MDDEARRRELLDTHGRAHKTAQALETHAAEVLRLTREIEALTDGTPGWYRGMRTRVEAGAALWQVRVLLDTLAELERRTSERST